MTAGHPTVIVTNQSTVLRNPEIEAWIPAFQYAVTYQFAPSWGTGCHLLFGSATNSTPKGAWQIVVLDDSDQAGALGYHDETPDGYPLGKIFAKTDLDNGYNVQVTFTHELFEMLADPDLSRAYQTGNTQFTALEVGDPVEADTLAYTNRRYPTVKISDFILPAWFGQGFHSAPYDHAGHCTKPLQVLPGGYVSVYVAGKGWTTHNAEGKPVKTDSQRARDRSTLLERLDVRERP